MGEKILGLGPDVFLLGFVSFLTDVSSEMIFSVFAVFFTGVLGASTALLGLVEGVADFSASSLDYVSGSLSDQAGKRKGFALAGYGFSALAKAFLVVSHTVPGACAFRVFDRLGKSFRGPPRDAWLGGLADESSRGYAFGVHKALDKAGAVLGPFLAYLVLARFGQTLAGFFFLFVVALVPALLAMALLAAVREKPVAPTRRENIFVAYRTLGAGFKHYMASGGLFSLAYFSFAFLLLKAYALGFSVAEVVLLYAWFNLAFVLVAAPIGRLGDLMGRRKIIAAGYAFYALMCLGFVFASTKAEVLALFAVFGVFYAIDESQGKAYLSDLEPAKKGTAIGLYNFVTGLLYLPASLIAGALWTIKSDYAFAFAAVVAFAALAWFLARAPDSAPGSQAVPSLRR